MEHPDTPRGEEQRADRSDPSSLRRHGAEFVRTMPLEAHIDRTATGWSAMLPVRAERVQVDKRTVVVEELVLHRHDVENVQRVEETVREERLRVDTEGEVEVRGPREPT